MSAIQLKILPFPNRPAYRLLCIIHKTIYINFPKYLLESLSHPEITSIKLRSSIDNFILQAHLSHSCYKLRSFTYSAPIIWNKLPLNIRSTSNHNTFKNYLNLIYKSYIIPILNYQTFYLKNDDILTPYLTLDILLRLNLT